MTVTVTVRAAKDHNPAEAIAAAMKLATAKIEKMRAAEDKLAVARLKKASR